MSGFRMQNSFYDENMDFSYANIPPQNLPKKEILKNQPVDPRGFYGYQRELNPQQHSQPLTQNPNQSHYGVGNVNNGLENENMGHNQENSRYPNKFLQPLTQQTDLYQSQHPHSQQIPRFQQEQHYNQDKFGNFHPNRNMLEPQVSIFTDMPQNTPQNLLRPQPIQEQHPNRTSYVSSPPHPQNELPQFKQIKFPNSVNDDNVPIKSPPLNINNFYPNSFEHDNNHNSFSHSRQIISNATEQHPAMLIYDTQKNTTHWILSDNYLPNVISKLNIKGEKGDKGEKGIRGERGDIGPVGLRGSQGVAGKDCNNIVFSPPEKIIKNEKILAIFPCDESIKSIQVVVKGKVELCLSSMEEENNNDDVEEEENDELSITDLNIQLRTINWNVERHLGSLLKLSAKHIVENNDEGDEEGDDDEEENPTEIHFVRISF